MSSRGVSIKLGSGCSTHSAILNSFSARRFRSLPPYFLLACFPRAFTILNLYIQSYTLFLIRKLEKRLGTRLEQRRNFIQSTMNLCKVLKMKEGFSEIDAKKQAFAVILPELRKKLGNVSVDHLQWMSELERDPVHRKIMKTRDSFVAEDKFDPEEALVAAVKKRTVLLERMLEERQQFPDEDEDNEHKASVPY